MKLHLSKSDIVLHFNVPLLPYKCNNDVVVTIALFRKCTLCDAVTTWNEEQYNFGMKSNMM